MKNTSIFRALNPITDFLKRYSLIIFIIIVGAGLAACVIILSDALASQKSIVSNSNSNNNINNASTSFDQSTINRLDTLTTSDANPVDQILPSGRVNPFTE
jgi:hypothetical protein